MPINDLRTGKDSVGGGSELDSTYCHLDDTGIRDGDIFVRQCAA